MSVYTKRGDGGKTSLYDSKNLQNKRVAKSSKIIAAIGAVDEVNSFIGICISGSSDESEIKQKLQEIQRDLFTIGAILAGADTKLQSYKVTELERDIDKMEGKLPVLTGFVLPGGSKLAADLFYARALVRRAERAVVSVSSSLPTTYNILPYLNRLSDYLFVLARWVNFKSGIKVIKWK